MVFRSRTKLSYLLLASAILGGCGYNQPNRFQMSFLPPAPKGAPAIEVPDPPAPSANLFLKADLPAILIPKPIEPRKLTKGDDLMKQADNRFRAGKRSYQMKDLAGARRNFVSAIDLILIASHHHPGARPEFDNNP